MGGKCTLLTPREPVRCGGHKPLKKSLLCWCYSIVIYFTEGAWVFFSNFAHNPVPDWMEASTVNMFIVNGPTDQSPIQTGVNTKVEIASAAANEATVG